MESKADKRKHLKACSERAPPAPELCQAIPNAAGHIGRSRLLPGAKQRAQRSTGLSCAGCAANNGPGRGQRPLGPSRDQGASPPVRQEAQPYARRRAAVSPAAITVRLPPLQPAPPHAPAPPGTAEPPPTAQRFKNGASHLPPAAPPAGARGARGTLGALPGRRAGSAMAGRGRSEAAALALRSAATCG